MEGTTEKAINQNREYPSNVLGPLMRVGLWLLKNVLTQLAKSVLIPLGLAAAISATNAAIQKKIYGSGMTKLIILN